MWPSDGNPKGDKSSPSRGGSRVDWYIYIQLRNVEPVKLENNILWVRNLPNLRSSSASGEVLITRNLDLLSWWIEFLVLGFVNWGGNCLGSVVIGKWEIMAGGGNFIGRVISYVANELIVNGLSNRYALSIFWVF